MNANKLFSEFSIKKIWDKLLQHDKVMNSTILVLSSGQWVEQEDGTFKNTVLYKGFTENDKLTVDLYDDGSLSETQLNEYEQYIDSFETIDGALVAIANTKPTQTLTLVVKGDFEVIIQDMSDITSELNARIDECFQSVSNGKALLASAITDKGVETTSDATFAEMAENINNIETSVDLETLTAATALASDITIGCTAWVNGVLVTGTRPAPLKSLTGSFGIWLWGDETQTVDVVFEEKFDELPTVTGSPSYNSNGSHVSSIRIYNVTTSGFTVSIYGDGNGSQGITGTYYWTARV